MRALLPAVLVCLVHPAPGYAERPLPRRPAPPVVVPAPPLPEAAPAGGPELVPGSFIVRWKPGVRRRQLDRVAGRLVVRAQAIGEHSWVYRLDDRTTRASREAIETLRAAVDEGIAEVVPVYYRYASRVPTDTWYKVQWHLKAARLDKAWDISTGRIGVKVAVVDTGVLKGHPDFDPKRLIGGYDFVSDSTAAADGDGWDSDPNDPGSASGSSSGLHGTHVAGIIGASTNNKSGVAAVDWSCLVVPVRALGAVQGGRGDDADIAAAIRYAAGVPIESVPDNPYPAHVINLSFGAEGSTNELASAIMDAQARGSIIIAAAGNNGMDGKNVYPAAYKNVITVGATDYAGQLAKYSNYGAIVDIMAPGGERDLPLPGTTAADCGGQTCMAGIYSLYKSLNNEYGYAYLEGTSQAAPVVSGIVSLMFSFRPLDVREATYILKETADRASMCPEGCGAGLVDAERALAMVQGRPIPNDTRAPFVVPPETITGACTMAGPQAGPRACIAPLLLLALLALARRRRY